jgi:diguanylate cyclase (GGDEF)-like protein
MDLFLSDEDFAELESEVTGAGARASMSSRVRLAWHLRERDTQRALLLAEQLLDELRSNLRTQPTLAHYIRRLELLQAEGNWLFAELDAAQVQASSLIQKVTPTTDAALLADTHLLLAHIAGDRADLTGRAAALEASAAVAADCGDDFRFEFARLCSAVLALRQDYQSATANWSDYVRQVAGRAAHPALLVMCNEYLAFEALRRSDLATILEVCSHTVSALNRAGMVRQVILSTTLLGVAFSNLDDNAQALLWMQRSLDLARPTRWPFVLGNALIQVGSVQRLLGRFVEAQVVINEGLALLEPLHDSRAYAMGLMYLAELQRDLGQHEAAVDTALKLEEPSPTPRPLEFRLNAMQVAALSLAELGRTDEALSMANQSLQLALGSKQPLDRSDALRTLATLHSRHSLKHPTDMGAASPALHYLLLSLDAFPAELQQQSVPPSIYDAIATEYAKLGDTAQAYAFGQQARAASDRVHSQDVSQRVNLLETKFFAERAATEREHLRQLATAAEQRADLLSQTSATLERLSLIGRQITGNLQEQSVYETLGRNVHGLLQVDHFSIYLTDASNLALEMVYGLEDGQLLPAFSVALSHLAASIVRCAVQCKEIFLDVDPLDGNSAPIPGTLPTLSAMFIPLIAGEQLLGAMSIQSTQPQAYAGREQLIFRSLAAYGAIAIENARNYRRLEATLVSLSQAQAEVMLKNQELERAYQSLKDISLTDPLTGLRNRRFLEQNLEGDVSQCLRNYSDWRRHHRSPELGGPTDADLLFFLVDIDHFKRVNDDFGHPAGDAVLTEMRSRLLEACRDSDYLVRWGGEEFLVVARAVSASAAAKFAERIRLAVARQPFAIDGVEPLMLTCSVGFASLPFITSQPERLSWLQVVGMADQALYMAKRSGRNAWIGLLATPLTPSCDDISQLVTSAQVSSIQGLLRVETSNTLIGSMRHVD